MKSFKSTVIAGLAVLIFAASVLQAVPASAQSSASLSIVPKKNYIIEPGKSAKDTLTVRNLDTERTLELTLRVVDFTYTDDGGTPKLMLAEDAPQTTWSLKPFISVPTSVSIAPKATKTLDMTVAFPASQGAGSYYSAILYSSGSPDGGNVGLSASGVSLVFASVPGEVSEDLKLEKLGSYNPAAKDSKAGYTYFNMAKPQMIAYTLKNNGNVTEAPVGSITLKDMFGGEQTIGNINPNKSLALVGQTRTFTSCIKLKSEDVNFNGQTTQAKACGDPDLWPGLYTVSLDVFYGQNGNNTQEITGNATFWYLPAWFLILLFILIVFITVVVWRVVRAIRRKLYGPKAPRRMKVSRRRRK